MKFRLEYDGVKMASFSSIDQLVNYISRFNSTRELVSGKNEKTNTILQSLSGNSENNPDTPGLRGVYKLLNSRGENVYTNDLGEAILNHRHVQKRSTKKRQKGQSFRFRVDPVPRTGLSYWGWHPYRRIRYFRDKRLAADVELARLSRPARRLQRLPDSWDLESTRDLERCWKSHGHTQKQWEHGLYSNRHSGLYVYKESRCDTQQSDEGIEDYGD